MLRTSTFSTVPPRPRADLILESYAEAEDPVFAAQNEARIRGFRKTLERVVKRLGISTDAVVTIGDMQNDLAMFGVSGRSFAMGNATDDVKSRATHVTASNADDGFAKAMDVILQENG